MQGRLLSLLLKNETHWGLSKMTMTAEMTNEDLLNYLIESANVPQEMTVAYIAGYFESTLLTLMYQFPEVRKVIKDRVEFRQKGIV